MTDWDEIMARATAAAEEAKAELARRLEDGKRLYDMDARFHARVQSLYRTCLGQEAFSNSGTMLDINRARNVVIVMDYLAEKQAEIDAVGR